jgi:hypothetical protein
MVLTVQFSGGSRDGEVSTRNVDLSKFPETADETVFWAIANHAVGMEVHLVSGPTFERYSHGSQVPGLMEKWRIAERETREDGTLFVRCKYLGPVK